MQPVYKIVLKVDNKIRTLFHEVDGSKYLSFDKWITANKRLVRDGSKSLKYISGIHVFKNKESAEKYLTKFRTKKDRIIIKCYARNLRVKSSNPVVFLADQIFIPKQNI